MLAMAENVIASVVLNPNPPGWGPGKLLTLAGGKAKIFFRDDADQEIRHLKLGSLPLELAPEQRDDALDNSPRFDGTRFEVNKSWVSFDWGWSGCCASFRRDSMVKATSGQRF
jgi:hypothetical protein